MSYQSSAPSENGAACIDAWLADPTTCDLRTYDVPRVLELVKLRLYDAWEHNRDVERQSLLNLQEALLAYQESLLQATQQPPKDPVTETETGTRTFQTLSEAVAMIAHMVESDAPAELLAQCAHVRGPDHGEPYSTKSFYQSVFPHLRERHQTLDLRVLYEGMDFPDNETWFTLGGHMKELGHIHIRFAHVEQGWVLDEILECR